MYKFQLKNNKVVFLLFFIPIFALYYFSVSYLNSLNRNIALTKFEADSDFFLNKLKVAANTEEFICQSLLSFFQTASSPEAIKRQILDFNNRLGLELKFCVWSSSGDVFFNTIDEMPNEGLRQVFISLTAINKSRKGYVNDFEAIEYPGSSETPGEIGAMPIGEEVEIRGKERTRLKELLGPEFNAFCYEQCYEGKNLKLIKTSNNKHSSLLWVKTSEKFAVMASLSPEELQKRPGLRQIIADEIDNKHIILGFSDGKEIFSNSSYVLPDDISSLSSVFSAKKHGNYYIRSNSIGIKQVGFCLVPLEAIEGGFLARNDSGTIFLFLSFPIFVAFFSYQFLFRNNQSRFPLKMQFILVFLLANLISGLVIWIISKDYLLSLQINLEQNALNDSIEILKSCDDLFLNELTFQKNQLEKKIEQAKQELPENGINEYSVKGFLHGMEPYPARVYMVGSKSAELGSEEGIVTDKDIIVDFTGKLGAIPIVLKLLRIMKEVGQFYLKKFNNETISFKDAYRFEAIVESFSKQSPEEQMLDFFENDSNFWQYGYWSKVFPSYIKTFSLGSNTSLDYTLLYMWTSFDLQKHYLETYLPKHSKNNLGLKLFAVANNFKVALPSENSDLDLFIEKIRAQEAQNFLKVKFNNQDGLFISIPGKRVSNFYLIGILPSENITREVKNTEAYMMKLFITCLLISVAFGFVTSSSVLRPLSALEQATDAIHKRDFTFRLPDLGNNEFGSLGMVINDLFVDYEEVFNASIIREKLLDSLEEPVQIGNLTIVSRSFVLSDSCPDFLHVKRPGEKELGFFLGTVEQTGVSANLILALTKGAIIQFECDDCQVSESLGMLQELFETFNQNSAHQKTISLLHGIVDGENSKVKFLNAGLKYALVWKQGILQVLKLPDNPPVGNAECNNFTYLEIPVNEGEILFLFSNGISSHDQLEQICNALNEVISKRRLEGGITQLIFGYFHEQLVTQKLKKDLSLVVIY